jgi:hypothetical protein
MSCFLVLSGSIPRKLTILRVGKLKQKAACPFFPQNKYPRHDAQSIPDCEEAIHFHFVPNSHFTSAKPLRTFAYLSIQHARRHAHSAIRTAVQFASPKKSQLSGTADHYALGHDQRINANRPVFGVGDVCTIESQRKRSPNLRRRNGRRGLPCIHATSLSIAER